MKTRRSILLAAVLAVPPGAWCAPPLADVHVHYKWSQEDVTTPQQAVDTLVANDIALAVVIGMPADYALRLEKLAPRLVVPLWSPYNSPGDWSSWAYDRTVLARARQALDSGRYQGIGELHLIGGFAPPSSSPVVSGLARLAAEFSVPLLLHTEFSAPDYLRGLCRASPDTRILWAHAGGLLTPTQVAEVLNACPKVWVELSARDPWRFVNNPIADADGVLLPAWRALLESFPDRFMVGSDPVWPVEQLDGWAQADTGWQEYGRFIAFHRRWIDRLPAELADNIRIGNALRFFRRRPEPAPQRM
jgi:hypothetical protein